MEFTATVLHSEVLPTTSKQTPPTLKLRLHVQNTPKKVVWRDGTVDNEHMNKKKSKCCCVYKKTLVFGESSSEEEDECEHCFGHSESLAKNRIGGEVEGPTSDF